MCCLVLLLHGTQAASCKVAKVQNPAASQSFSDEQSCATLGNRSPTLLPHSSMQIFTQLHNVQASDELGSGSSTGVTKPGMASLMRRAVQKAKAEAAAQAAADAAQVAAALGDGNTNDSQGAPEAPADRKKALAALLKKAAQKMQEEEGSPQQQESAAGADATLQQPSQLEEEQQHQHDAEDHLLPSSSSTEDDPLDTGQVRLSRLSDSSSSSSGMQASTSDPADPPLYKTPSLGNRLGSMLKSALSPSRQSSYMPVDADSSPEADAEANQSLDLMAPGTERRAPGRDANLSQRLGSMLKGALSFAKQPSYIPVNGDDPSEDLGRSPIPRELSLREKYGSFSISRQASIMEESDSSQRVLPRELSLRERYGSRSISREPSISLPAEKSPTGLGAAHDPPFPMSPGSRRALPRDASYLPEWVHRTLGRGPNHHGDGLSSPRSRLGTTSSNVSADSDGEDHSSVPTWVNFPSSPRKSFQLSPQHSPQHSSGQPEEEVGHDLASAAPIMMAPPHLRRQQQEPEKAETPLPRAKRPLALASNPLLLSLVHTPSMNPQLDLRAMTPVATPKGQRLFDFWHQKTDQPTVSAQSEATLDPSNAQLAPVSAFQQAGSSPGSLEQPDKVPAAQHAQQQQQAQHKQQAQQTQQAQHAQQAQQQQPAQHTQQAQQAQHTPQVSHVQPAQQTQHVQLAEPMHSSLQAAEAGGGGGGGQPAEVGSVQPGTASAALVAEMETASRLVHTQSLQQAQLLEGLERALSQLSEHRLLVQNPQPAAAASQQQDKDGMSTSPTPACAVSASTCTSNASSCVKLVYNLKSHVQLMVDCLRHLL